MADTDFYRTLQSLGLEQYHGPLVAEAFDSWSVLSRITEQDMTALGIRLGHRRILQDAIANCHGVNTASKPMQQPQQLLQPTSPVGAAPTPSSNRNLLPARLEPRQKRKYTRHPKVDEHAPARPPTGYVMFSNWVREHIKDQQYEFPDIAKLVGKRWQALPKHEKEWFLNKAKEHKAVYTTEMARYKRTAKYREYQRYLLDFKIRNGTLPATRRNVRTRSEGSSTDDEEEQDDGQSRSEEHMDEGSDASEMESNDLPPVRYIQDRSPPSLPRLRSPGSMSTPMTLEPPTTKQPHGILTAAIDLTNVKDNSEPKSAHMSFAERLPSISGVTSRQLPPLPCPPFRH